MNKIAYPLNEEEAALVESLGGAGGGVVERAPVGQDQRAPPRRARPDAPT